MPGRWIAPMAGATVEDGVLLDRYPYHRVGDGAPRLLVIPGLGDAFRGEPSRIARFLARYRYGAFADERAVWIVSRRRGLPEGYATRDMASDYAAVLDEIGPADVLGVSMGGLVAQHLAIDYPDLVSRLVLASSASYLGREGREIVRRWREWGREDRAFDVHLDTVATSYVGYRRELYGLALRALGGLFPRPASATDLTRSCEAFLDHDAHERIREIAAPTLLVAGRLDRFFPEPLVRKTASRVPNASLTLFDGVGHALDERKRAFDDRIARFLDRE